jgi:hypothetical protein
VDAFVLAGLEHLGLRPSEPAARELLVRRLSFDLLGLPPAPDDVDAFVADASPDACDRLADRLLASPRYGERWGRHWLDLARFNESHGFEYDRLRENAWRYRDYVIESLNADKPYDRFAGEQLAGDVTAPRSVDGTVAAGFLVLGPWDQAGAMAQKSALMLARTREEELEDTVSAVCQTFLGLTVQCARCHDHKFDPIPQRDYYRVQAVFAGVRHGERPLPAAGEGASAPRTFGGEPQEPPVVRILRRGDVEKAGDEVAPGGVEALQGFGGDLGVDARAPEAERRRRFAAWVVHPENPLTARVAANRLWHYHFGRGLVATPSDFGRAGEAPSHPQLLDWLACELRDGGWSLKRLHRLLVLSAAYRQGSRWRAEAAEVDVEGAFIWRFAPRRLEGEAVRDAMLCASGELDLRRGGPGFRLFEVKVFNSNLYSPAEPAGPDYQRRSVYRMQVNSAANPLLDALDCPDPSVKTPARSATTTPLQALSLMNSSFVERQARAFARRIEREAGMDTAAQVAWAFRVACGRTPDPGEEDDSVRLVREHGLEALAWALFNAAEFIELR